MKTMLLPLTLLLAACGEDPHIKEIEGLRAIIAQNDIDKKAFAEEMGVVRGDYEQAKQSRDACYERGHDLEVFVLAYVTLAGIKADTLWVCHPTTSDSHPETRAPYIATEWSTDCEDAGEFNFVFDAAGNPQFAPYE